MNNTIKEILKKITTKGYEAYVVGGYARDLYLGKTNQDIDICTNAKYKELKKIFPEIKQKNYLSYNLIYKKQNIEITTYRKEKKYIKSRFPQKIKYTKKLKKDLKRRDFIINTLCLDENENYIDILNAKKDLNNKIIRIVGPKTKIKEDSLRILRAIRFATILNFKIDEKLNKAIQKYKNNLNQLSFDRKKQELEKIFKSENINYGIKLIKKYELESILKINLTNLKQTKNINGIWAQIIIDDSYNFSKEDKKQIITIQKLKDKPFKLYNLYKYGKEIFETISEIRNDIDIRKYDKLVIKDRNEIKITFFDIIEICNPNSNNIDNIYEDLEKQIIYKNIKNKKETIIKYLKQKYQK